ncbi:GGDEF domain-containing protein [Mycolicibacterium madagascariense]|uniref:GGDEF domain-containing protein n=1 Tax=Mycolicibacterium madagascariense TaxID=212765 RepID=UPI0013D7E522|nr:GGDEF domain-containing protein [Mycolicibacterium madagascariense]MCV7015171.1 GGDEF domain-containing protein [Mycolicibacterium madagascariense]
MRHRFGRQRRPTAEPGHSASGAARDPGLIGGQRELGLVEASLRVPERRIRYSISAMVPTFGLIAAVMMCGREGPASAAARAVVIVVVVSTLPVGVIIARSHLAPIWWTRRSAPRALSTLFVLYGDAGVSIVLFTLTSPEAALSGTPLLAILSAYAAYFCSPATRNLHIAITTTVITVLTVMTYRTGEYDVASTVGRFLVAIVVVNGTVLLESMFATGVRRAIRDTLVHAHQDPLTQLWNRRGFTHWARATVEASRGPVGMLFVDIDEYKAINDTHGHRVGDDVLQLAARRLADAVGSRGVLARTGGDEFAVVAELDLEELTALAHTIRTGIHRPDDAVPLTASIGVAAGVLDAAAMSRSGAAERVISAMLHAADTALYRAKKAGRNRVAYVDLNEVDQTPRIVESDCPPTHRRPGTGRGRQPFPPPS